MANCSWLVLFAQGIVGQLQWGLTTLVSSSPNPHWKSKHFGENSWSGFLELNRWSVRGSEPMLTGNKPKLLMKIKFFLQNLFMTLKLGSVALRMLMLQPKLTMAEINYMP